MDRKAGSPLAVVRGVVSRGDRIGRTLGFPTANIACASPPVAPGVYASLVLIGGGVRPGASYWGPRPTVGRDAGALESHIFDFDGDLYGEMITVALVAQVRGDARFADLEALRLQMRSDCRDARRLLASGVWMDEQAEASRRATKASWIAVAGRGHGAWSETGLGVAA